MDGIFVDLNSPIEPHYDPYLAALAIGVAVCVVIFICWKAWGLK